LLAIAVLLCAATTIYALVWMYDARHPALNLVEIGFNRVHDTFFDPVTSSIRVYDVEPESPAARAGLQEGDRIIALNGSPLTSYAVFNKVWSHAQPGDTVDLTVRRPSQPSPLTLHAIFRLVEAGRAGEGFARASAEEILGFYPIFFVLVGFAVLFLRLEDAHAWLLALLFAGFVGVPSLANHLEMPGPLRIFTSVYRTIFSSLIAALFYIFFALFPEKSPLERRAPWLKWVALVIAALQLFPGLPYGDARLPGFVARAIGYNGALHLRLAFTYGFLFLGLVSLLGNCTSAKTSHEARRKSRVLLLGTFLGIFPFVVEHILIDFTGYRQNFWIDGTLIFLVLLYPLAFAYSIIRHRVLEIPALLRRSVRYVLVQRGYFLLLFCGGMLAIFLFARFFSRFFAENSQFGMTFSAAFGVALVWVSGPLVKRGTDRIDRAFFRRSYDARMILQDLAEKIRAVSGRAELAALLERHLKQAFHPKSLAIYFVGPSGELVATGPPVPGAPATLDANAPCLRELTAHGRAWDVPPPGHPDEPRDFPLCSLGPECLVPLLGHQGQLMGLLAMGQALSEEPYSREDKRLLDSVAGPAAVSLENMRMAEQIADRLAQDRRAAQEMQIARDVQARLFPQLMPPLATLEYAGRCIQARQVGGDYYDFLDLGGSHMAFVLADVSGKGIASALLMANLQANLRSRYAIALDDLPRLLKSVNQLFYENTPDDRYATMFFALYDDRSREFQYANCGHNPPLLFRAGGGVELLSATSTVVGLFPDWECVTRAITLQPGDVLVIYTDGVTEANDAAANEFGMARLRETALENLQLPPADLLTAIQEAVQKFSAGEQFDDLTLVVARARSEENSELSPLTLALERHRKAG